MKHISFLMLTVLCLQMCHHPVQAASELFAEQVFRITPQQQTSIVSVPAGGVLEFTAADLEQRLGMMSGELQGITITSLPPGDEGELVLYGVEVEPYQFIARNELEGLCFVPGECASTALTVTPHGGNAPATRMAIYNLDSVNHSPVVESSSYSTVRNARFGGFIPASDPDDDKIFIQVTRNPQKGEVVFDGQSFVYQPYQDRGGSDFFSICAVDRFGNYSQEAIIDVEIERNRSGFQFVDMADHPSGYAAFKLHQQGIYSGQKIGESWFFFPDQPVTRGKFLALTLAAAGTDRDLSPAVNTQLENDNTLPFWLKPYVQQAIKDDVWQSTQVFFSEQIPTRAEAVQMVARAANIQDVKEFSLQMNDLSAIPNWALSSYRDLAAYRMLDLHDGNAYPDQALDNAYAADLLWQLYKHVNR